VNIISQNIKNLFIQKSKELGFEKIGFAKADILEDETTHLETWLKLGYDADMKWIEKGFSKRKDVKLILEDAKSVVSLAYNYYTPFVHDEKLPKISRYAWGKDYHKVLEKKLKLLIASLSEAISFLPRETASADLKVGLAVRSYVDTGPVMDKAWAVRAGIGWLGKHTNVITECGSWVFLCSIITNIEFDSYNTPVTDQCGSCTLCISACPTGAITDEYVLDSNKCISYQTIENHGEIPEDLNLDGWIFGCDVCQDVCPYNLPKYTKNANDESFYPKSEIFNKSREELEEINEEQFTKILAVSPIKRTKYAGWKRNLERFE